MNHYTLSIMGLFVCATLSTNLHALSRDGLYLGAGIGASFDKFDLTSRNTMTGFKVNSPSIDKTNGLGNVFIGFGGTAQNGFYLGGELGTYFPKRDGTVYNRPGVTLTALTFNNKLQVQDYLTADVLPGYRMNEDWLIYGRLGLSYANLSIYQWPTIASPSFDSDEKKIASRIGAGLNYSLNNHFGLGLDYFYSHYPQASFNNNPFNIAYTQKTSSNYIGISALYTL